VSHGRVAPLAWRLVCAAAFLLLWSGVQAQALRDPTVAPAVVSSPEPGSASEATVLETGRVSVLLRDGVPYLVLGTRLYAVGQHIGRLTIERVTETEVWLREDGILRKVPVFAGVDRRAAPTIRTSLEPTATTTSPGRQP